MLGRSTCVRLWQEHASDADRISRLTRAGEAALEVDDYAAGGSPLGHLWAKAEVSSTILMAS